jgi:hypothetical protein
MRESASVRLTWSLSLGPACGGSGSLPRGFLPASRWAWRRATLAWCSCAPAARLRIVREPAARSGPWPHRWLGAADRAARSPQVRPCHQPPRRDRPSRPMPGGPALHRATALRSCWRDPTTGPCARWHGMHLGAVQLAQIEFVDDFNHEAGQVILGRPFINRRRQQIGVIVRPVPFLPVDRRCCSI